MKANKTEQSAFVVGSGYNYVGVTYSYPGLDVTSTNDMSVTAYLTRSESIEFTNELLRTMRKIDPDFVPDGFSALPRAETLRPHVRPVPRRDPPLPPNGELASRATDGGSPDPVNPDHYKIPGLDVELWDVIEALELDSDAALTQAFQYVARAKDKGNFEEDLRKAIWYLARRIGCDATLTSRVKK